MMTAVDTPVLLDILLADPRFCQSSEEKLRKARQQGRVIVCETVIAEISPVFTSRMDLKSFLEETGIEFEPSIFETALLAGEMFKNYLMNKVTAKRVLPDFLVASHAVTSSASLLARDRGYYREYFKDLKLIDPGAS